MSYETAFQNNHTDFEIGAIVYADDADGADGVDDRQPVNDNIDPEYARFFEQLETSVNEPNERLDRPRSIELEYTAPSISVDTAGRFATHEIIGGSTVRQKIGEEPIEVTVDGVVKEPTARQMDNLRNAAFGTIYSERLPNGSLQVQFASTSTAPLEDGGAVAITDDEFLYTFTLSCVEVFV